ncbi:MAG: hypothetical protein K9M08_20875 [Pirellula sp.]|nr:hypothetical protein [Pirellula sp.]
MADKHESNDGSGRVAKTRKNVGRPRTAEQIEKLILKLAKDNAWGYTRILGELKELGIESVTRNTVKIILKRNGYESGPKRGPGTWDKFLKIHAKTMWQCDFFSKKVVSISLFCRVSTLLICPDPEPRQKQISTPGPQTIKATCNP